MFQDYNMNPQDLDFQVIQMVKNFDTMFEMIIISLNGKEMKLIVKEQIQTHVGFIKLGSPLINSKPRNDYLGGVPDLPVFNKRVSWVSIFACSTRL